MWVKFWAQLLLALSFTPAVRCGSQHPIQVVEPHRDGCQAIAGKRIVAYHEAVDCYRSFPFKEKIREGTLDSIFKALPFYAFIDISRDSPEPRIPAKVDLYSEVKLLKAKPYANEMDFHLDLAALFRSLHDGHTVYHSGCFTAFVFRQPFFLITVNDLGAGRGQKFLILEEYAQPSPQLQPAWQERGINISRYLGAEVIFIDALPPITFLEQYADRYVGSSRDANSRLNLALSRVIQRGGSWGIAPGSFAATTTIPPKPSITYTLRLREGGVETITVPYLATGAANFTDAQDFYAKFCAQKASRESKAAAKAKQIQVMEIPEIVLEKPVSPLPKRAQAFGEGSLDKPLTRGNYTQTWMVNRNTGVMTIVSFSSDNETQFLGELERGFLALQKSGATNLLLDLSNNGGGIICWGYYVLDYLFPSTFQHRFSTDMHGTPLLLKLASGDDRPEGFFNFAYWTKADGANFSSASHYTSLFNDRCGLNPLLKSRPRQPPWDRRHLAVVTNSICYSTCSLLVNSLQELYNITTYALGGLRGRPATACSIQGGTVYNLGYLLDDLEVVGLSNHNDAPKQLPTSATFSFTIREAYSTRKFEAGEQASDPSQGSYTNKPNKHHPIQVHRVSPPGKKIRPLEFTFTEASFHPAYPGPVTFLSPFQQWRQVADDFFNRH
ncbi:hypothetical protein L0F63_000770 [Massospora cicadina]|nr:hypothetical protein L0F63_000770 [Massospora cicadina]